MKKVLLLIIAIGVTTISFGQQFLIKAKLSGFKNGTKFYLEDPEMQKIIDSATLKNNAFSITGKLDYTPKSLFLSTTFDDQYYWCFLFIGNEKVVLKGDKQEFPFYLQISGSKSQDIYNKLNEKTRSLKTRRNAITANLDTLLVDESNAAKARLKSIGKQLAHIDSLTDSIRLGFIRFNLNTYPALNELYSLRKHFSRDSLQRIYNKLRSKFKYSIYGERIKNYIEVGDIVKVGDKYDDFEAVDQFGTIRKLSEFTGKYLLLNFSETYCGPCIFSINELKEISKEYADSLVIVNFCVDKSKKIWEKGLQRDTINWASLWDGNGYYGQTVLKYGVQGYPTFFLISPKGKILLKWSGYGKGNINEHISTYLTTKNIGRSYSSPALLISSNETTIEGQFIK